MARTFDCPKCGAPVNYSNSPVGQDLTVKCNYCNSVLAEPNPMLGRPAQVIQLKIDASRGLKMPKWVLLILLVPLFGLVLGVIGIALGLAPLFRSTAIRNTPPSTPAAPKPLGGKEAAPGFATTLVEFGTEGIGPGMFSDARSIAVDGAGNIYVGEYSGGRIQVFDPAGKFFTQWTADPKMPLRGLAVDRKGTVYVSQSGRILKYEGTSGTPLGELAFSEGQGFDSITATADGGLIGGWYGGGRDHIVRFNAAGQVVGIIKAAVSSASGSSELDTRVATDGQGNIYALGTFNLAVFKFGPDGKFINRFGGRGNQPGQLSAPAAIAADGLGRVFVSDANGIQIFGGDGRFVKTFKPDAYAMGMVFNDQNELFVAARTKVLKLALAK